jgi:hypothetical protein
VNKIFKNVKNNKYKIKIINRNAPICIFSSGIFTKAYNSNSALTRKHRLCFPECILNISVTTAP